jgi:hypothetical protein
LFLKGVASLVEYDGSALGVMLGKELPEGKPEK